MIRFSSMLIAALAAVLLGQACQAQSIWHNRLENRVLMFRDVKARRVGDLITVVISENTAVTNKDERALAKDTSIGGVFDFAGSTTGNAGTNTAAATFNSTTTSDRSFDGSSEYKVNRVVRDRITVRVLDVLPNGYMVIGGKREQIISGERRTLVLRGIVRPFDIRFDNSVESQSVGALRLAMYGKGPESSFSNQGWLGRLTNKIWPF